MGIKLLAFYGFFLIGFAAGGVVTGRAWVVELAAVGSIIGGGAFLFISLLRGLFAADREG